MRMAWGWLLILCLLLESCNSDFNVNAPHQDIYVLNCILRNDSPIQYALISKNYFTENGTAPPPNSIDGNIKGADIRIYNNDSVFVMRDTTIQLADSGNETRVNCYYVKNLELIPGQVVSIEASVPDGDTLTSTTRVPQISYRNFSASFPQRYKPGYQVFPNYSWSWDGVNEETAPIFNLPQLEVYYQQYENGAMVDKKILVPLAFYFKPDGNGNLIPVNVNLSINTYCIATLETVNKTMQEISGDDPVKSNYTINKVVFSVSGMDSNLSKYYSAYNTYSKDFTIKLRQTDFSNIEGGKGIFGVYYKSSRPLVIDRSYIWSFGYRYDPR